MASDREFLEAAVRQGFLAPEQTERLLAALGGRSAREVSLEQRLLSVAQADAVASLLARPTLFDADPWDRQIGEIALSWGLLDRETLNRSETEQRDARARGENPSLGELLVHRGSITTDDLIRIVREQGRRTEGGLDLPRYEIRARIGEGSTAMVYHAWDRELKRPVALKLLRESSSFSDIARQRFRREAQAAAGLRHPNVVTVYDVGEQEGRLYLVMELVEGSTLGKAMRNERGDLPRLLRLFERAARGVAAAHAQGIVHRDLKPENILVTADGEPKVGDFGLAHVVDSSVPLTRTGAVLGTPLYMAPEQVEGRGQDLSPRTDVYALGAILYEAATGRPPHHADILSDIYKKIVHEEPVAPRRLDPGFSLSLEAIILKALAKDPSRRYDDAGAIADDIARHLSGEAVRARPPDLLYRGRRWLTRHRVAVAGFLLAAAAGAWGWSEWETRAYGGAMREGGDLWAKRLPGQALPLFERAARLRPRDPGPHVMAGRCRLALGQPTDAERSWNAALALQPDYGPALFERGKQIVTSIARLRVASTAGSESQRSRSGPAELETAAERAPRLRGEADLAAARGLSSDQEKFVEGAIALGKGKAAEAAAALRVYAELHPFDAGALALLGIAQLLAGDPVAAEARLGEAIALDPRPAWLSARAETRLLQRKFEQALADFARADDPEGQGLAWQALGRLEEARQKYAEARRRRPDLAKGYDPGLLPLFLDDFEGGKLDLAAWNIRGDAVAERGQLKLKGVSGAYGERTFARVPGRALLAVFRGSYNHDGGPVLHWIAAPHPEKEKYAQAGYGWGAKMRWPADKSGKVLSILYPLFDRPGAIYPETVDNLDTCLITVLRPQGAFAYLAGGAVTRLPRARLCFVGHQGAEPELAFGGTNEYSDHSIELVRVDDLTGEWSSDDGTAVLHDSFKRPDATGAGRPEKGTGEAWRTPSGGWRVEGKRLLGSGRGITCLTETALSDGWWDARVDVNKGGEAGLVFRARDAENFWYFGGSASELRLMKRVKGKDIVVFTTTSARLKPGQAVWLSVRAEGERLYLYCDDERVLPQEEPVLDPEFRDATLGGLAVLDGEAHFEDVALWPLERSLPEALFDRMPPFAEGSGPDLARDTFSGADGTRLTDHAPELGGPWQEHAGNWTLHKRAVTVSQDLSRDAVATLDVGRNDMEVEATITSGKEIGQNMEWTMALVASATPEGQRLQDFIEARFLWHSGSCEIELVEMKKGTNGINLTGRLLLGRPYRLRLAVCGRQATAFLDDVPVVSLRLAQTHTGTRAGIRINVNGDQNGRWENFRVREAILRGTR
ncbi:MAG TPA: protein kinase [Planctomycetota bacterium]|nr:protein kinase [Planctomycetota bacterium]